MQEDAIQVYLRHRDAFFDAILKSDDFQEEATDYRESILNLKNHDLSVEYTWPDHVCYSTIRKETADEESNPFITSRKKAELRTSKRGKAKQAIAFDLDKRGKGAMFSRFAAGEPGRHKHHKMVSVSDELSKRNFEEGWGLANDGEKELAFKESSDRGYDSWEKTPEDKKKEILDGVFSHTRGMERSFAGSHYLPVTRQEHLHSEWPKLSDEAVDDGISYWHEKVHPLRKQNSRTGRSVLSHTLKDYVWKDDWDKGESVAEKHAALMKNHEEDNSTHQVIRGLPKTMSKTLDEFTRDEYRNWKVDKDIPMERKGEMQENEKGKVVKVWLETEKDYADREKQAKRNFQKEYSQGELETLWNEEREANHSFIGSILGGAQGNHTQDLLYERNYNNWHEGLSEREKNEPESVKRQKHMEHAQNMWESKDDYQTEKISHHDAEPEELERMKKIAWEDYGAPEFSVLSEKERDEIAQTVYSKSRAKGEGERRHYHQLGWLGYMLGLEWLDPKDRTAVTDHLMEHGSDTDKQQEITLSNGDRIPMGLIKRNFLMRFSPEYLHTQRGHSKTAPNRPKWPESHDDTRGVRERENRATHNALTEVLGEGTPKMTKYLGEMYGFPLDRDGTPITGKREMPISGVRNISAFNQKVTKYKKFPFLCNECGKESSSKEEAINQAGECPDCASSYKRVLERKYPVYEAMRDLHDKKSQRGDPLDDYTWKDFLGVMGWKEDKDGKLEQSEKHGFFGNKWSPDHPSNFTSEEMERIRDIRNSFMGFSKQEKDTRNILAPFKIGHNGPTKDEEGWYPKDSDGVSRGFADHFGVPYEGGGYSMLDSHVMEALSTLLSPLENNYESRWNPKTRMREVMSKAKSSIVGLLGTLSGKSGFTPTRSLMGLLSHFLTEPMRAYDKTAQSTINLTSMHGTTVPYQEKYGSSKMLPGNNKNNSNEYRSEHLHGVENALDEMTEQEFQDSKKVSQSSVDDSDGAFFAINPRSREINRGFRENPSTVKGLKTNPLYGDKKIGNHTHEFYRDGTSRGVVHRPGDRFSFDQNAGIWRSDENGEVKLGAPHDILSLEQMMLLDKDHRTTHMDSDSDFRQLMDSSDYLTQLDELSELPLEKVAGFEWKSPSVENKWGFKTLGELRGALEERRITQEETPEDERGFNREIVEMEELYNKVLTDFIESEGGMQHHYKENNAYNEMKRGMSSEIERVVKGIIIPNYLREDPDAFDKSNPKKFISNHAMAYADAETMVMHLSHETVKELLRKGESETDPFYGRGLTVTAPDVRDYQKPTMEGVGKASPHLPISAMVGHIGEEENGANYGVKVYADDKITDILDKLGLSETDENTKMVKDFLSTLPPHEPGEQPAMRRVMTVGNFLQKEGEMSEKRGVGWHGLGPSSQERQRIEEEYDERIEAEPREMRKQRLRIEKARKLVEGNFHFGYNWHEHETPQDAMAIIDKDYRDYQKETGRSKERPSDVTAYKMQPALRSVNNIHRIMSLGDKEEMQRYGLSYHTGSESTKMGGGITRPQYHKRISNRLNNLISHESVPAPDFSAPLETIDTKRAGMHNVEIHPGRGGKVHGGVSIIPYHSSLNMQVNEGSELEPSVGMNVESGNVTFGTNTQAQNLVFPSHDSYDRIHGEGTADEIVGNLPNEPLQWTAALNQRVSAQKPVSLAESDPSLVVRSLPTSISGLLLKDDLPKEMPLIEPMHKIFEIEDLNQLRGFTGEWVVSVFYEGKRIKVKKKGSRLTITDSKHKDTGVSDSMRVALRKLCKKHYIADGVLSDGTLYICDVMEYDGTDVTDMSTRERIKILRGQFDSHEGVIVPSPSTLKITDEEGLKVAVESLLEDNKDAKLLLRDATSSYMKGEEKHPKWIIMTKSDDNFHIPFGMEIDEGYFILHFEDDLVKYEIVDDSPQNPMSAMAALSGSDYPIRLAKSLEPYWMPVFEQMFKESTQLQDEMSPEETEEESAGIIKPGDKSNLKKPKDYLKALLIIEAALDKLEKEHYPMTGGRGTGIDVGYHIESPRGPTKLVAEQSLPDWDAKDRPTEDMEKPEDYPGRRKKAKRVEESSISEEELDSFGYA